MTQTLAEKPTRARYLVMLMLFVSVVVTFMDRSNLSITAPAMRTDLGIDTVHMGWILSAFGWTYAFCQIPAGWLVDRIAPRFFYPGILILWSAATVMLGVVGSVVSLICIRLLIGALEAPSYMINNMVVSSWFPDRERAGRHRLLHLGPVRRLGLPHADAAASAIPLWLARGVLHHRRRRTGVGV